MVEQVYRRKAEEERGVVELKAGAFRVPSYTDPEKTYLVHPESGYCQCWHHFRTNAFCKHLVLAEAIQKARALKRGAAIAEENVTELCQRVFAPKSRTEHYVDSYRLFLEVDSYRHSTKRMVEEAVRRHGRVLAMHESRAA